MQAVLELIPLVAFFLGYRLYGLYIGTGALMVAMLPLLGADLLRQRRISSMHGLEAALVFVFGTATLLLHDHRYIQWKPTVFFWIASLAFLLSFWIGERPLVERLLGKALGAEVRVSATRWRRLNGLWVAFYALLGAANLAVAFNASERTWVNFKVFGLTAATFVFILLQVLWLSRHGLTSSGDAAAATDDPSAAT
ncbi:MAG TPA: inner membrane-spanning protein YciB [Steroidobacteraceae bacterium]|nr:inner membrane-spanning protein YciB [Steroidobacteraceae bacterium]